jgi:hypothetical protein
VSGQARELELNVCDQSNIQDNFQTATDALQDCNVVEHRYVDETICKASIKGYILQYSKEN